MYKKTLVALAVLGIVLPYWKFIPWVLDNGLSIPLLIEELFSTRIGAFFGLDVVVSALVLLLFIFNDSRKAGVKNCWIAVVCTLSVGVSFGLPIYLLMRENSIKK